MLAFLHVCMRAPTRLSVDDPGLPPLQLLRFSLDAFFVDSPDDLKLAALSVVKAVCLALTCCSLYP